jgi:H+/Cl- antiporter ClcA
MVAEGGHSKTVSKKHEDAIPVATPVNPWYFNSRAVAMSISFMWTVLCGIAVALVAFGPSYILAQAQDKKYEYFDRAMEKNGIGGVLGASILNSLLFASVAASMVAYFGKIVGGSGLPQLISHISCGYSMDTGLLSLKTLVLKNIALTCAVISGVAIGREGPAIHIGASTALHVGRAVRHIVERLVSKYAWLNAHLKQLDAGDFLQPFSGMYEHEILHIGAAAGFACAFNAPLGGMMFVYEEIASHWTQHSEMGGRVFFGVGVAIGTQRLIMHGLQGSFALKFDSIIVYDPFTSSLDESWQYADIPFFFLLAIFAGVFTGVFSSCAFWVHKAHRRFVENPWKRAAVAVAVSVITAIMFALAPAIVVTCSKNPSEAQLATIVGERRFVSYGTCEDGYHNEMASLTLCGGEAMIHHAFARDSYSFDSAVCAFFLLVYVTGFIINTGSFMPAGNFVPNVIMGGIEGRLFGNMAAWAYAGTATKYSSPGVYAVIGATCQLCCFTRTMPAIMVTMFEVTSDTSLTTPMLIFSTLSRSITNWWGMDGWVHTLYHSPHLNLPHHKVHPSKWRDQKFMKPEECVAHPHAHDDGHGDGHGDDGHEDSGHEVSAKDSNIGGAVSTSNPMVNRTPSQRGDDEITINGML